MALPAFLLPLTAALMKGFKVGATGLGFAAGAPVGAAKAVGGGANLLKSAYFGDKMGMVNLAMDALPIVSDAASGNLGVHSFSGIGGTMLGTKFGGRELNKLGDSTYKKLERTAVDSYNQQSMRRPQVGLPTAGNAVASSYGKPQQGRVPSFSEMNPNRDKWIDDNMSTAREKMLANPTYSKQGYNMPVGMGADIGLYSLTSGMNKPKQPELDPMMAQPSPVSRYMQMTGGL